MMLSSSPRLTSILTSSLPSTRLVMVSVVTDFMSAPFGDGCVRTPSYAGNGQAPHYSCHRGPRPDVLPVSTPGLFIRSSRAVACAISSAAALVKQRLISACTLAAAHV